jgi:feruloyl esterase
VNDPKFGGTIHRLFLILCVASLIGVSVRAETTPEERVAALKELKIESGTVSSLIRDDSPAMKAPDGKVTRNNMPPRTVIKVLLTPAQGTNIHVEIWLPDAGKWNGRFVGLGNGGAAGHINSDSLAGWMSGGFAVATTDMGTAPAPQAGNGNKEVWKDFGFRATHLMTVVGKQFATAYYGKAPEFSYFNGGSTGGQQALQEAQRYPEDYDGIAAAVPAHCRTPLHAYFLWNDQILKKCPFNKTQEEAVIATGTEYMAAKENPAAAGKFVSDPRCTAKDIDAVVELALKKDATLTKEHAEALRKLLDGPHRSDTGERIFNGIPFGSSISASHGHLYLFNWVFGAQKKTDDVNFGADIDAYTAALAPWLNAENPDLSAFAKRGGKLIISTGTADSIVPYHATVDYYERVIEQAGGLEKAQSFARLYVIPGMGHGGGGPGINQSPNIFDAMKNWRETGTAPNALTGKRVANGKTEIEMPIFPYPAKSVWDAASSTYKPVDGPRGGIERVATRFLPAASE